MEAVRDLCATVVAEQVVDERGDKGATAEGGEDGVRDRIDVEALGASLAEVLQSSLALGLALSRRWRKANFLRGILRGGRRISYDKQRGLCLVPARRSSCSNPPSSARARAGGAAPADCAWSTFAVALLAETQI